ncbi:MAG: twin-arginine translocase TatA/TatE family subunit [Legionellales bacterium]|nr:twin-arginine translocase TatA/TatE family subunit [Legionellales bacterium]
MGISGISPLSLLLVFMIAVLLFGSKRLSQLGKDLGSAIAGFNDGLKAKQVSEQAQKERDDV